MWWQPFSPLEIKPALWWCTNTMYCACPVQLTVIGNICEIWVNISETLSIFWRSYFHKIFLTKGLETHPQIWKLGQYKLYIDPSCFIKFFWLGFGQTYPKYWQLGLNLDQVISRNLSDFDLVKLGQKSGN